MTDRQTRKVKIRVAKAERSRTNRQTRKVKIRVAKAERSRTNNCASVQRALLAPEILNESFLKCRYFTALYRAMTRYKSITERVSQSSLHLLGRPGTSVPDGRPQMFSFFRHAFSEVPRPIALKLCHTIANWLNFIIQVKKFGGLSAIKIWGQKHAKYRPVLDHFRFDRECSKFKVKNLPVLIALLWYYCSR